MTDRYDDIINLPYHKSKTRAHMSNYDRAAQFSPFAALKGYEEEIAEAARITEDRIELDEARVSAINKVLQQLKMREREKPRIKVTFFQADRKERGAYQTLQGELKQVDESRRRLVLENGDKVLFDTLFELELL